MIPLDPLEGASAFMIQSTRRSCQPDVPLSDRRDYELVPLLRPALRYLGHGHLR